MGVEGGLGLEVEVEVEVDDAVAVAVEAAAECVVRPREIFVAQAVVAAE